MRDPCIARKAWLPGTRISNSSLEARWDRAQFAVRGSECASGAKMMWFLILAEGVLAFVAAIAAYLSGYLDGRKDIRAIHAKMVDELRDFE
jgi:hypothetical protein